ncbi:putative mitochondrial protein [Tanacetum coccineum]
MVIYDEETDKEEEEHEPAMEEQIQLEMVEVSANSMWGFTAPHTMKLQGKLGKREVVVLIDSGATHNFLSVELVSILGLRVDGKNETRVRLGNGKFDKSSGLCRSLVLHLLGLRVVEDFYPLELGSTIVILGVKWLWVVEDFYPLELGSTDVILGVKWLRNLGDVRVNWKTLTMSFKGPEGIVVLKGEPILTQAKTSLQAIVRDMEGVSESFPVGLAVIGIDSQQDQSTPAKLDLVLKHFSEMFEIPEGLPPQQDHEHAIVLKGGTEPISVRPYRYP